MKYPWRFLKYKLGNLRKLSQIGYKDHFQVTEKNWIEHVKAIIVRSEEHFEDATKDRENEPISPIVDQDSNSEKVKSTPNTKSKGTCSNLLDLTLSKYLPPLSYPGKVIGDKLQKKCDKFEEILKNLNINIPYADTLAKISHYEKFLKIFKKKRKVGDSWMVKRSAPSSDVLLKKIVKTAPGSKEYSYFLSYW